jgi:signal transduction histidine kinase/CheY-like chemotaxis protein
VNSLFSLASPAPTGFLVARPTRAELLSGSVAVYAEALEDVIALLPNYAQRVAGLVLIPGSRFESSSLGEALALWEVPNGLLPELAGLVRSTLELQERLRQNLDHRARAAHLLERQTEWVALLQKNYNETTEHLINRLDELRRESERRLAAEEELRQAEKMRAMGQLAGGVAHDFNNMLGGIIGAAELLQVEVSSESGQEYLKLILDAAERAGSLTRQLLAFTRKDKLLSIPVNLHEVIRAALLLLERSIDKRVTLTTELKAEAALVMGDASQLQNVFLNLGINAAHAMPNGGELFIGTCDLPHGPDGPRLEVRVRDCGAGILPEHLPHIFEPFFTTKAPGRGTGLGLAAVYGTIQDHRGRITVTSELGAGTEFRIQLPCVSGAEAPSETRDEDCARGAGCVLIIDDEPLMRATARGALERLGYSVLEAKNGRVGIELYRAHHARVSVVLLDMLMPELSGGECFDALQSIDPNVRVVACSGFTEDHRVMRLKARGLRSFLRKPFRIHELAEAIALAAGSAAATPSPERDDHAP